ncbi:MAG: ABC transporter ATP-binding protein [SAR202 cluster bacterium]|nr:ABC transporter ATP-binding protein [SAR202 cluster bacterium]|tara:strand:+ start:28273 stop:29145 length:873 start_codon:yes stop_codon:yes gene_type:complete
MNEENLNHISCEDLFKIYKIADLEVVALRGLDLEVESGEIVAIVGASGSGKSTLLNILAGYDLPSAGKVSVLGRDLLSMSSSEIEEYRRTKVGFIWQQTGRNMFPYLTAIENVELPMMLIGDTPAKRRKRAQDLLELVGLGDRMNHTQDRLSGGEQQRVAIAISLANNPPLLLADEPTGELDDATASEVMKVFDSVNQELNTTIMIVSHDQDIAYKVDRVVLIRDGKLSTEIIRQKSDQNVDELEEFIIFDGSGRVQVPKTLLDRTNIERRAKVRIDDKGVILEPGEDKK